jgi:hypothetical protein
MNLALASSQVADDCDDTQPDLTLTFRSLARELDARGIAHAIVPVVPRAPKAASHAFAARALTPTLREAMLAETETAIAAALAR